MMRDETYYPEPHRFLPGRFLNPGQNPLLPYPDDPASDPSKIAFGFGRRLVEFYLKGLFMYTYTQL